MKITPINQKQDHVLSFFVEEVNQKFIGHLQLLVQRNIQNFFKRNNVDAEVEVYQTKSQIKDLVIEIKSCMDDFIKYKKFVQFTYKKDFREEIEYIFVLGTNKSEKYFKQSEKIQDIVTILSHQQVNVN